MQAAGRDEAGPDTGRQERTESENQFADANRRLDKDRDDAQSAGEGEAEQQAPGGASGGPDREAPGKEPQGDRPARPQAREPSGIAQALSEEERMAAQQWLRRIPDDPGGLLRRKFLYQYRQRGGQNAGGQGW